MTRLDLIKPVADSTFNVSVVVKRFPAISETFILRQICGMLERGHRVRIVAEERPAPGESRHADVSRFQLMDRVTYTTRGPNGPPRMDHRVSGLVRGALRNPSVLGYMRRARSASLGGRREVLSRLGNLLSGGTPDVVHCHYGDVGLAYRLTRRALGIPLLVTFHGFDFSRYPLQRGQAVYAPLFADVDLVTVGAEYVGEKLVSLGCPPEKVRELHVGVDPKEYSYNDRQPPDTGEPVRLLSVARLVEKKGLEYAIRAVAHVSRSHSNLLYEIIGDGPLRPRLEKLIEETGLSDRVVLSGAQPQNVVRTAMARAHLFLLPSVTASDGDQEGTPTVLMEASSTGLPILTTWHSGIPEIVLDGRTGFLVPERDEEALADRLGFVLSHPAIWSELGYAGRKHVESEFDIHSLNDQLESIYREAISLGSRRH